MTYYDAISDSYDELYGEEQLAKYRALASLVVVGPEDTILDLGHGTGLIAEVFDNRIVGVDTAAKLLERSPCETKLMSIDELDFDDASFDWVVSFTALHHARDPALVVSRALRIARGGVAVSLLRALDSHDRIAQLFAGWDAYPAGHDTLFVHLGR